jgi:hypothetical protein
MHYYRNLNQGGHFGLTEAGKPTASVQRSRLIVATASVNRLTEAGIISQPPQLIHINQGSCPKEPASVKISTEVVG